MRIILALSLMAAILVACGGGPSGSDGQNLPTADVRVTTATPEPLGQDACSLSTEQIKLLLSLKNTVVWADYGFNEGKGRGDGIGLIVFLPNNSQMEIPACARQAAIAALH